MRVIYLEVLPAYWGIETPILADAVGIAKRFHLEVLPAYWGIETATNLALYGEYK